MPITLTPRTDDRMVFESTFAVDHPGVHTVRVWSGEDLDRSAQAGTAVAARAATLQIPVELSNAELDQPVLGLRDARINCANHRAARSSTCRIS